MRLPSCINSIGLGKLGGIVIRGEIGKRTYMGYSLTDARKKYVEEVAVSNETRRTDRGLQKR